MARRALSARSVGAACFAVLVIGVGAPATAQMPAAAAQTNDASPAKPEPRIQDAQASPTEGQPAHTAPPRSWPLDLEGGSLWSVFTSYGFNQRVYRSATGIDIASTGVRWSHLWRVRGNGVFRGHPGLGIELVPFMSFVEAERATYAFGSNLLYEHHFTGSQRVLPIWRIGVGLLYATRPVPAKETQRNFSVLTELGIDITVSDSSALSLGYRFHHVSNANAGPRNPGINVHSVIFGLSYHR